MLTEEEQIKGSDAYIIATAAAKTLLRLIVYIALLLFAIRAFFPLEAMRFYDDLGNVPAAHACACSATKLERGQRRVSAMLARANYAIALYDAGSDGYAAEVVDSVEAFLADEGCRARIPLIDEYNLSGSPAVMRPNLYSFEDYLLSLAARASVTLESAAVRFRGESLSVSAALAAAETENAATDDEIAVLLGQIAAICEQCYYEGKAADIDVAALNRVAGGYISCVISCVLPANEGVPDVKTLYLIKAYEKLVTRLTLACGESAASELASVEYGGEPRDIHELYDSLLESYAAAT